MALFHDIPLFDLASDIRFDLLPLLLEIEKNGAVSNCVKHFDESPDDFKVDYSKFLLKTKFCDFIPTLY
jgi:hypothetical protein